MSHMNRLLQNSIGGNSNTLFIGFLLEENTELTNYTINITKKLNKIENKLIHAKFSNNELVSGQIQVIEIKLLKIEVDGTTWNLLTSFFKKWFSRA